jgi:hypothetical protein
MPDTPLTEILKDFRKYRPGNHRDFLEWVKESAAAVGIQDFSLRDPQSAGTYFFMVSVKHFLANNTSFVPSLYRSSARL